MLTGKRPRNLPLLLLSAFAVVVAASLAHAASPLGIGAAEATCQPSSGALASLMATINAYQQSFYRALTGSLRALRGETLSLMPLIGLSFVYGVFHAAGPGHGKLVVSSYMLANEIELRRGILVSFLSALLQGAVAIIVVLIAYFVLRGTAVTLTDATRGLEITSYLMIVAFGLWLLARKLRHNRAGVALGALVPNFVRARTGGAAGASATADLFASSANMASENASIFGKGQSPNRFHAQAVPHDHDSLAPGSLCHSCGLAHMPDPALLGSAGFRLGDAMSAVLAVGLRPCAGALLVMTFALLNGLVLGGILSVLAMALGTAITVSVLASLAVGAKSVALKLSGPGSRLSGRVVAIIEIAAALALVALGLLLTASSVLEQPCLINQAG